MSLHTTYPFNMSYMIRIQRCCGIKVKSAVYDIYCYRFSVSVCVIGCVKNSDKMGRCYLITRLDIYAKSFL